jgi:DNA-binding beta-propeller fold protein YncE
VRDNNRPHWVAISSTGAFAYVANYPRLGPGTVSAYTIDGATGSLTPVPGSPFEAELNPYSIALAP